MAKKVAVLTGGGHAAGLNAGIAGVLQRAQEKGCTAYGALDGWQGVVEKRLVHLSGYNPMELVSKGGSVLGSSRTCPTPEQVVDAIKYYGLDAIIALGGDDTLGALRKAYSAYKAPVVGWPKTMDNDLSQTHFTAGFPTTLAIGADAVAKAFDAATTHGRVAIVVLFGRHSDWVAAGAGAYGSADLIIPAERSCSLDDICQRAGNLFMERKEKQGKGYAVLAVAEGCQIEGLSSHVQTQSLEQDQYGHVKLDPNLLASYLSGAFKDKTKELFGKPIGTAPLVMTYQLRNGTPVWVDMRMGYELGMQCLDLADAGDFGNAAVVKVDGDTLGVGSAPLEKVAVTRMMEGTGMFDYAEFKTTPAFIDYARPFAGDPRPVTVNMVDRSRIVQV